MKNRNTIFTVIPVLTSLAMSSIAQAVSPPPDGGYAGNNTAEGTQALQSLTGGIDNTALGFQTIFHNTAGNSNTAEGFRALFGNTIGHQNTATGVNALASNTTGNFNTATGPNTLNHNINGSSNTATGVEALFSNTTGNNNVAVGVQAGISLTTGNNNIDIGNAGIAGESNTIRVGNPAIHAATFIAGINGVTLSGPTSTVIVDANGQLGSANSRQTSLLYDYGNPPLLVVRVNFPQPPFVVGTAISKSDDATFILNQDGVYRVTYSIEVFQCATLEAQLQVADVGVGPTMASSCGNDPTPITDQVTLAATAGSTVRIVLNDFQAVGRAASINIDKLQ